MLPVEPSVCTSKLHKLKPQAKLPSPPVLQALSPADNKLIKRLVTESVEYVADSVFDQPEAEQLLRRSLYAWDSKAPDSDDSGVYVLKESHGAFAEMDRERYLFLRLNYCRRQVLALLEEHAGRRLSADAVAELLRWEKAAAETRGEIVRENVPLVLAMAKRTRITGVDLTDLISEGNLALLRAVNKFDCSRGYKFSTYACRAILKSFSRVATRMSRHRGHFPTEFDPSLERSDFIERNRIAAEGDCVHELKAILAENGAHLSEIEHKVVMARFALDAEGDITTQTAQTLEQVGQMIGVTKERVRQIQNKALCKLRAALEHAVLTR